MSAEQVESTEPDEQEGQDENTRALIRKAYTTATSRLRDHRRDEFNEFMTEETKRLGIDWSPRLSAEEKAWKDVKAILSEHPDLAGKVRDLIADED